MLSNRIEISRRLFVRPTENLIFSSKFKDSGSSSGPPFYETNRIRRANSVGEHQSALRSSTSRSDPNCWTLTTSQSPGAAMNILQQQQQ